MTRRQLLCILCVALCRVARPDIDDALYQLGAELAASARRANARSIAVPEFICGGSKESLGGQTGALGRYAAEEVERALTREAQGAYAVADRRNLDKVRGWQKDLRVAREFVFVDLADSVAGRMNFTDSIGLITAAFYRELPKPVTRGGIGTGEGEEIEVKIRYVKMEHEDTPIAIQSVHYGRAQEAK